VIPALGTLRQKDDEFKNSLGYIKQKQKTSKGKFCELEKKPKISSYVIGPETCTESIKCILDIQAYVALKLVT
jgi:hypothetical protein